MGKSNLWLIGLVVVALAYAIAATKYAYEEKLEADRLHSNQDALLERADYYKTEAGASAATIERLTLNYDELQKHYGEVCQAAKDLKVKVSRMESASRTATQTEVQADIAIKDSIVINDNFALDTIKVVKWRDPWVDIYGHLRKDSLTLNVCSNDTLIQIVHRVPKKFLFIKYGTKAIRQEIRSSNPHTRITYTEYIELKK